MPTVESRTMNAQDWEEWALSARPRARRCPNCYTDLVQNSTIKKFECGRCGFDVGEEKVIGAENLFDLSSGEKTLTEVVRDNPLPGRTPGRTDPVPTPMPCDFTIFFKEVLPPEQIKAVREAVIKAITDAILPRWRQR